MTKKVAVLGSCLTRDIFNSNFNKNYKDYFNCILTQNQTSIISLMSEPVSFENRKVDNLNEYDKGNIKSEFSRDFLKKIAEEPIDYLVIDFFADVHFGVLSVDDNKYLTNNRWKLWKTTYYQELPRKTEFRIQTHVDDYIHKWSKSIDEFFDILFNVRPSIKVIINDARYVDYYLPKDKDELEILSTSGKCLWADVEQSNFILNGFNNHISEKYNFDCMRFSMRDYYSMEEHPWGPFYVHYNNKFYEDALSQLISITNRY